MPSVRVVVAELEVFCSRPHAPTRRIALGRDRLPCDPAPGPGGVLLGGIAARFVDELDPDSVPEVEALLRDLEHGRRIAQPRLRYRLQVDHIGLNAVTHRLVTRGEELRFEFDDRGAPAQQVLAAAYAAGRLAPEQRRLVIASIRRGLHWRGPLGRELLVALGGVRSVSGAFSSIADPRAWALDRLGFVGAATPTDREVQRRYRERLRDVHPDHGGTTDGAAQRIAELAEARRLLTGR